MIEFQYKDDMSFISCTAHILSLIVQTVRQEQLLLH